MTEGNVNKYKKNKFDSAPRKWGGSKETAWKKASWYARAHVKVRNCASHAFAFLVHAGSYKSKFDGSMCSPLYTYIYIYMCV